MPSLKTAAMTVAIMLVALFLIVKFAPPQMKEAIGVK